jgi:hypothetical protein
VRKILPVGTKIGIDEAMHDSPGSSDADPARHAVVATGFVCDSGATSERESVKRESETSGISAFSFGTCQGGHMFSTSTRVRISSGWASEDVGCCWIRPKRDADDCERLLAKGNM